jgi:hypothetical protein
MGWRRRFSWSRRPFASSQRTSVALPDMVMSPSVLSLISWRRAATSSPTIVVLFQSACSRVLETTYLGALLRNDAKGSSLLPGQKPAHSS